MYFRSTRTQCQWQALHVSFLYDLWFSFSFYWTENPGHCDHEQFYWTFFLFFFYFGLFLFHNCTRCLFCVRSVLFFLKCYHSSCPFVWGTIAQSTVSNILRINSFTPRSNQFVIYPYHLDTLSSRKMMWSIKKKLSISAYCLNWHQELWSKIRVRSLFIAGGREGILAVAIKFTWSLMRPVVF